ncbi:MAG: OmpH family outer membrane protein [Blastochloris viridis]|uniref:OmpH family outer membrane protein n=1 Tax=Blastochloris viridis TaxID=1079 RepID=A0A6N4REL4_BLAVI|nr:MAG: OmpH family outer membrane protein [Blastochloris viridis]
MKTTLKAGVLALVMAVAAVAGAQAQAKAPTIAVFDAQQVINGTNAAKRAISELTGKRNAAQSRIDALEKPLLDKQQKLRSQQGVMAADKFQQAQADFAKELNDFRQQAQKIQGDLDDQNMKLRKTIADAVKVSVEGIAKEKGYDIVLPKGVTFYTSPNVVDISAEVLARANKALDK